MDPQDLEINIILDINIYLVDISNFRNYNDTYDTMIQKELKSFWNFE